jgi:mRNA-degrading endonuclease RelE of RelBE toxin-antitoxin system
MKYKIEFVPRAVKDLRPPIDAAESRRIKDACS